MMMKKLASFEFQKMKVITPLGFKYAHTLLSLSLRHLFPRIAPLFVRKMYLSLNGPFSVPGLPANAKTSGDYMEGLFDVAEDSERKPNGNPGGSGTGSGGRKRYGKNFSPVALKNRIEVLQNESKK